MDGRVKRGVSVAAALTLGWALGAPMAAKAQGTEQAQEAW
jgi:hypothetical protein